MRGHFTVGAEPKFRVEREQEIARTQVADESKVRVGRMMDALNDESDAFECSVSFVRR